MRAQKAKWAAKSSSSRAGPRRPTLWLGKHAYAAWTIDGELVVVCGREPGAGGNVIRRPTDAERHRITATNCLIEPVIALEPGQVLDDGPVRRYQQHQDLATALKAALAHALQVEESVPLGSAAEISPNRPSVPQPPLRRTKGTKTRFHPCGNYIVYLPALSDLPGFAITVLPDVPPFESRRLACRFLPKLRRRGKACEDLRIARVLARVRARPRFRPGFPMPREDWRITRMVRKEPRVVEPQLDLEWLPRYWQDEQGQWQPEGSALRRTVRHGVRDCVLERLQVASIDAVRRIQEARIRRGLGDLEAADRLVAGLEGHQRLATRANRILPSELRSRLGLDGCVPDWQRVRDQAAGVLREEDGHWVRAPFEFKAPGDVQPRVRIVELRIDDLAALLEQFGLEPEFWMIKDRTDAAPRWVLPTTDQ